MNQDYCEDHPPPHPQSTVVLFPYDVMYGYAYDQATELFTPSKTHKIRWSVVFAAGALYSYRAVSYEKYFTS